MSRIIREGDRVFYERNGKRYILYKGIDLLKQGMVDDSEMVHYMAFIVGEHPDDGGCFGFFYITGFEDEDLLECCDLYFGIMCYEEDEWRK